MNWLLFIAVVLVFVSGIMISEDVLPSLGLSVGRSSIFGFWHQLHTLSANAVLVLSGIHLGLNWRWVVNAVQQVLPFRSRSGGSASRTRTTGEAQA